jgi:hypothetical protein
VDEGSPRVSGVVTNCTGCQIEYHRDTGAVTIRYCADHDAETHEDVVTERDRLYRSLRRMADGAHAGEYADAKAALDEATALLSELGERDAPAPLFGGDMYTRHCHRHPAGGRERHAHNGSVDHAHPDRRLGPAYDHDVY